MRYITGSRMLRFGEAMSIFARSVREPSGNSPARMRSSRSRFSSTERLRYGLSVPGSVRVPRYWRTSSAREIAHIGFAGPHQLLCPLVELAEIVGGVEQAVFPIEPQPAHVVHDGVDVLLLFLFRIGVVEAQVGFAAELRGEAEVQADGFGVADVQIAVRLRREPRVDTSAVLIGFQVFEDDLANEIRTGRRGFRRVRDFISFQFPNGLADSFEAGFAAQGFERPKQRGRGLASAHRDAHRFEHLARFDAQGFGRSAQRGFEAVVRKSPR